MFKNHRSEGDRLSLPSPDNMGVCSPKVETHGDAMALLCLGSDWGLSDLETSRTDLQPPGNGGKGAVAPFFHSTTPPVLLP